MLVITNTSNNVYNVSHDNAYSIFLRVRVLNDSLAFELYENTATVLAGDSIELNLPDGFYIIDEYQLAGTVYMSSYYTPVYVAMQNSLNNLFRNTIRTLSCLEDSDCDCEALLPNDYYTQHCYLMASGLFFSYLSLLNKIMMDDYIFTTLTPELNARIITLSNWHDGINRYLELLNQKFYGVS